MLATPSPRRRARAPDPRAPWTAAGPGCSRGAGSRHATRSRHGRGDTDAGTGGDRRGFATGVLTDRTFAFDVRQPLAARLLHVDEPRAARRLGAPHEVLTLPDGHVAVTVAEPLRYRNDPLELLTAPGGLVEL